MIGEVRVDDEGLQRKLKALALAGQDVSKPLRIFGGYLRKKARERYKAQDFAPLAESTVQRRAQSGLRSLERKLKRDVRKAVARNKQTNAPRGILARFFGTASAGNVNDAMATTSRGVKNRLTVLAAFQAKHQRKLEDRASAGALSFKQQVSLSQREERAVAKAVGRPILGKLIDSLIVELGHASVTVKSRTSTEWSAAHNEGDGHVPQRETLPPPSGDDLDFLVELVLEHLAGAVLESEGA